MSNETKVSPIIIAASVFLPVFIIFIFFVSDMILFPEKEITIQENLSGVEYKNLLRKYQAEYEIWTLQETIQHHEWNLRSTKYIFWLSIIITLTGIVFSFWQFTKANQFDRQRADAEELSVRNELGDISFKTRSIASLILFVSIIYMFMYVMFLYPISYLPPNTSNAITETTVDVPVNMPSDPSRTASEMMSDPLYPAEPN